MHSNDMVLQQQKYHNYHVPNPAAQAGIYQQPQQLPSIYHIPDQTSNTAEKTPNQRR